MKRLIILCTILAAFTIANAQSTAGMTHSQWEENETHHHKSTTAPFNEFVSTEMAVNKNLVTFSGLPAVKKCVYAVVTNAQGEFIKQTKVSADQNVMDISRLHSGLYFVTILYKNQSKIAFTLNR
jgi:hypothetical protein